MNEINSANRPKTHELNMMNDLCSILKPFEDATNESQGQNVITSSKVIIIVWTLREQLNTLSKDCSCRLLSTLEHSVNSRLTKYEQMEIF